MDLNRAVLSILFFVGVWVWGVGWGVLHLDWTICADMKARDWLGAGELSVT